MNDPGDDLDFRFERIDGDIVDNGAAIGPSAAQLGFPGVREHLAETAIEVIRADLRVGDVILSKQDASREFRVEEISAGMSGRGWPHLALRDGAGNKLEHDTSLDPAHATYTVRRPRSEEAT